MLSPFAEIVKDCHVCMLVRAIVVNMELPPVRLLLSSRSGAAKQVSSLVSSDGTSGIPVSGNCFSCRGHS